MAKHKTDSIMPSVKYDKWEAQTATLEKAMRDAVESDSKGMPNEVKQADAAADRLLKFRTENPEPKRPPCPRMIYDVLTVEKMHQAFANYPLMVVMSDEGGTFVGSRAMNKESAMSTMALINKAYGGDPINKDIKSTEPEVCPTPRFTMHLMLQPGVFDQLTAGGQARDIGLISRALLCEPESTRGTRFLEGREEGGTFGIDLFNQNISQLLSQQVVIDADGKLICKEMRMSPEAKTVWVKFHDHIEALVGDGGIYAGISDMAGKVAENAARLATQFAFFEGHASITKVTMLNACSIVEWYLNESLVLLGLKKESEEKRDAVTIESWIIKECIKKGVDYVTERDVSDNINCRALRKESGKKRRMTAFNLLVECRRLRGARAGNSFRLYPLPDLLVKARENML
jgi:putative DNA primase/helicase